MGGMAGWGACGSVSNIREEEKIAPFWKFQFGTIANQALSCLLILLLLASGCATSRYEPPTTVSEDYRKACDEDAHTAADAIMKRPEPHDLTWLPVVLPFLVLTGAWALLFDPKTYQKAKMRTETYEQTLRACLEPLIPGQPEDPQLTERLHSVANRHAVRGRFSLAEPLYRQALAIREKTLGGDHIDIARILEDYAELVLRRTDRDAEAEQAEARAKVIRAKLERQDQTEARPEGPRPEDE